MRTFIVTLAVFAVAQARPDTGYGAPEESYGAPTSSYGAPAASYDAPAASYDAPAQSYDAPSYAASAPASVDLTVILLPVLALIGLFLLFPTYVSLSTVRRKREAEDEDVASDVINRIQGIYEAVVQSEECIESIACNAGALARDVGISPAISASAMLVTPKKYAKYAKQFAMPADCSKLKCGKLF